MQREENSGQNDEEEGCGVKSESSKDKRRDSRSKRGMNEEHGAVRSQREMQILLSSRERRHYGEHECGSLLLIAQVHNKDKPQRKCVTFTEQSHSV